MLKFQVIGYCGKDAVVQQHGIDSVINFSVCHTDKYKDASGQKYEKSTWIHCSWWTDRINFAQYVKKGTLLWVEGIPEAKQWKDKQSGELKPYLSMRVSRVELLNSGRDNNNGPANYPTEKTQASQDGYKPVETEDFSDLPF